MCNEEYVQWEEVMFGTEPGEMKDFVDDEYCRGEKES